MLNLQRDISAASVNIYRLDRLIAESQEKVRNLLQRQLMVALIEDFSLKTDEFEEKVNFIYCSDMNYKY